MDDENKPIDEFLKKAQPYRGLDAYLNMRPDPDRGWRMATAAALRNLADAVERADVPMPRIIEISRGVETRIIRGWNVAARIVEVEGLLISGSYLDEKP